MEEIVSVVQPLWSQYKDFIISIGKAAFIGILGVYLAFFTRSYVHKWLDKQDQILSNFVSQAVFVIFLILTAVTFLGTLGVQTTSIVAVLGTIGLTIALALKNSLSSLASGVLLIILRPFKKNDLVEIGAICGRVESINLFQTTIRLSNSKLAIFPNDKISNNTIINCCDATKKKEMQWLINVNCDQSIRHTQDLIYQILSALPLNTQTSEIFVDAVGITPNGIDFCAKIQIQDQEEASKIRDHFIHTSQSLISGLCSIKEIG